MAKHNIKFEIVNKSDLFIKYKIRLELLQVIYGDNAKAGDINKKIEEIRKGAKMNTKQIERQLKYCKNKIERLESLFHLPISTIKANFNILDIDLIIKELTDLKELLIKEQ